MPNKILEEKAKALHNDLLDDISRDLDKKELKKYKTRLGEYGGFRAREIEDFEDIEEIFEAQQKRKVFSVGQYGKLKDQLRKVKCDKLVTEVENVEEKLEEMGYRVFHRGESMDATPSDITNFRPPLPSASSIEISPSFPSPRKEPDMCYTPGRGYVLYISNFFHLPDHTGVPRPGVQQDKKNISEFFREGYDLEFCPDVSKSEDLWDIIKEVKKKVENKYSSFFFIISSHGKGIPLKNKSGEIVIDNATKKPIIASEGIQLLEKDVYVPVDEIVSKFEYFMLGKPKVLIFQACRSLSDTSDDSSGISFYDGQNLSSSVTVPKNADTVVIHDTSKGGKGWRNEDHGAWIFYCMFVQAKFYYEGEHLLDVLTRVNDKVSRRDAHDKNSKVLGKQMPCFTSTFTRFFYVK
ncbi:caspase-3-like [Antedon mediterranea]|uniref:caspase-3-like n=1 Tax=Antedon mediterranea TaxID=105859 RepID=UPI003AF6A36B